MPDVLANAIVYGLSLLVLLWALMLVAWVARGLWHTLRPRPPGDQGGRR